MADYSLFSPSRKKGKHPPIFFPNSLFSPRKCNIYVTHFIRIHEEKIFHPLVGKRFKNNRGKKEYRASDSKLFCRKKIDKFLVFGTQSFSFSWIFSFHIRVSPAHESTTRIARSDASARKDFLLTESKMFGKIPMLKLRFSGTKIPFGFRQKTLVDS